MISFFLRDSVAAVLQAFFLEHSENQIGYKLQRFDNRHSQHLIREFDVFVGDCQRFAFAEFTSAGAN
jgi:hypothetical protein